MQLQLQFLLFLGVLISTCFVCDAAKQAKGGGNAPKKSDFESFKKFHGKEYESPEQEAEAKKVFTKTKKMVEEHNKRFANGEVKWRMELNQFADIPEEEFDVKNGHKVPKDWRKQIKKINQDYAKKTRKSKRSSWVVPLAGGSLPESWDWRNVNGTNYVTPVKQQKHCGTCYAFAAVNAIESQVLIAGRPAMDLSEEQVADCSPYNGGNGCSGGWFYESWKYIEEVGGVLQEKDYPYTLGQDGGHKKHHHKNKKHHHRRERQADYDEDGVDSHSVQDYSGEAGPDFLKDDDNGTEEIDTQEQDDSQEHHKKHKKHKKHDDNDNDTEEIDSEQEGNKSKPCKFPSVKGKKVQKVRAYNVLTDVSEETMKQLLINKGPLAVTIDVHGPDGSLQHAGSGIFHTTTRNTDHVVLLVGYGTDHGENGGDYWLIKNSWSPKHGMDGYFKISRDKNENAAIDSQIGYVEI